MPRRMLVRPILVLALAALAVGVPGAAVPHDPDRGLRSTGCGLAPPQEPGEARRYTLADGDRERSYLLHLPEGYTPGRAWPVLLAYHGRGGGAEGMAGYSGVAALPAVVVLPDGVEGDEGRRAWQGAPYSAPGVDDVAFTHALLDTVESRTCVDRTRVYAAGMSNGGGFAEVLACAAPGRITAVAAVAAAFYPHGLECDASRPVPVVSFHGTDDATIPYAGDPGRGLPDIAAWNADRAAAHGCRAGPEAERTGPDVTALEWSGCDRGAGVRHVVVEDGGHTWPGAPASSGPGHTTATVEAYRELWRFVSRYRLPLP